MTGVTQEDRLGFAWRGLQLDVEAQSRMRLCAASRPDSAAIEGPAHLIQVALTPVFLLTAIAGFLNVFAGRLARAVRTAREGR